MADELRLREKYAAKRGALIADPLCRSADLRGEPDPARHRGALVPFPTSPATEHQTLAGVRSSSPPRADKSARQRIWLA
jgi:hypothetical protein